MPLAVWVWFKEHVMIKLSMKTTVWLPVWSLVSKVGYEIAIRHSVLPDYPSTLLVNASTVGLVIRF